GPQEIRLRKDERGRQSTGMDEFLRAVAIAEDAVDECGALDEGALERIPLVRGDDKRHRVNLPGPLHAARVPMNVVGDALLVGEAAGGLGAALEFREAELVEVVKERGVMG